MISNEDLLKVLKEWNLWEKKLDYGILRTNYLEKIFPLMSRKEIIVIKGIRRSGKSTIIKQLIDQLIKNGTDKKQILYLSLEDYNLRDSFSVDLLEQVLKVYLNYSNNKNKIYYFIDEIQNIPDWESYLRTKYDLNKKLKFIVSGSNASLLSKELSTLLTGRNITFQIKTLSWQEFHDFNKQGTVEEFITYGGFPEVVLEKNAANKKLLLQQYFEDIINKDIISRYQLRNVELIFNLAKYLLENSGGKVSQNKLSKTFGVSDDTIGTYISYMLDSYLIIKVPFFSYSVRKRHSILMKTKYYASDNGLVYAIGLNFSENLGKKYETATLLQIYHSVENISYWSGKNEVDFIFDKKAVNVTIGDSEREILGLQEFKRRHHNYELTIVTQNLSLKSEIQLIPFSSFEP